MDASEIIIFYILPLVVGLATVALAIITYFYMKHTRNIARVMQKQTEFLQREFELKISPLATTKVEILGSSDSSFSMRVRVINHGAYPLYFDTLELLFKHEDQPEKKHFKCIAVDDYIKPEGEFISPDYEFDYKNFPEFEGIKNVQHKAILGVLFNFLDVNKNSYTVPREGYDLHRDIY